MFFVWTQNAQMGDGAQLVIGGGLDWSFSPQLNIGAGVTQNPGTRSLRGTFPYWHRVDTRLIADEYHRPSYTTGFYVYGNLSNSLQYKAVLGNNLSQLGVNAVQLDANFNTVSTSLTWSPQGEFGPRAGWGDFESHDEVVTNFGMGLTRSREDRQSQPLENSIENSQIRLSDGTRLFEEDAFGTGGRVNRATYRMASLDAGMKYRGFDVSGGYYARLVDDFETEGVDPRRQAARLGLPDPGLDDGRAADAPTVRRLLEDHGRVRRAARSRHRHQLVSGQGAAAARQHGIHVLEELAGRLSVRADAGRRQRHGLHDERGNGLSRFSAINQQAEG